MGIVQALFEASMYVFILEWTPALTEALNLSQLDKTDSNHPPIPHGKIESTIIRSCEEQIVPSGYIFASYMVAMMMGSNSFKLFCNYGPPESFMR